MATPRHDDQWIPDPEDLYRRISKDWIVPDKLMGGVMVSSAAFRGLPKGKISVHLSSMITPEDSLAYGGPRIVALAAVTAGEARELDQEIVRDAQPGDAAHALICGKQGQSVRRKLARLARWIRKPNAQVVAAIIGNAQ